MNLREFGEWALKQGQVANPPPNYKYAGQCVSLVQQYLYQVLGIPFEAHGNAKDWANNVPKEFEKLSPNAGLQRGDILVYGSNYGNGYGHIGIIDCNWKFLEQNGDKKLKVSYRDVREDYICILRYKGTIDMGDEAVYTTGRYVVNTEVLTVRRTPEVLEDNWLTYEELTENAQKQVAELNPNKPNGLVKGVECDISEVQGSWGKAPSGWICLDYCTK